MLFLLTKTKPALMDTIQLFAGNGEKAVLLTGDAVFYAGSAIIGKLRDRGVSEIFVLEDAAASRAFTPDSDAEVVSYADMAKIIMNEFSMTVCL